MRRARFSDLCVDAKADAATLMLDGGYLRVYDGGQPEDADTPVSGQTCLAVLRFSAPAFAPAFRGRALAYAFLPCLADVQGTPTWFRAFTARGASMFDGSVGPRAYVGDGQAERGIEEYDMYVEGDLFEGGEVVVDKMVYVECKR